MKSVFAAVAMCALVCSCAFAKGVDAVPLFDRSTEADMSKLVGATEEHRAAYFPDGKLQGAILSFLVQVRGSPVVFDAGLPDGHVAAELAKNGLAPADVKTILMTHLHRDHYGGLVAPDGTAAFPNAQIYVSSAERAYWVDQVKNAGVISALDLYAGRVHEFAPGDEVVPGVTALDTSGHTPGHVSFMVEEGGEKLLILGDLVHFVGIQLPVPEVCVTYDVDPAKAAAARRRTFDFAAENAIPVAGMHIPFPGMLKLKKSGGGYAAY
ncbi:MAG: MBL fold metallo-hydrolase [Pyramidobacter sp.]|nr:MBL fold metallo-hydrolase [Pyramidobacter sp.]